MSFTFSNDMSTNCCSINNAFPVFKGKIFVYAM